MRIISEKKVTTRKSQMCFACVRTFAKKTKMTTQVVAGENNDLVTVYLCDTCEQLICFDRFLFWDEMEECFPEACVKEKMKMYEFEGTPTPEEFLVRLKDMLAVARRQLIKNHSEE